MVFASKCKVNPRRYSMSHLLGWQKQTNQKSRTTPDAGTDMVQLACSIVDGSTENGEIFGRFLIKVNMNILLGTWLR